MRASPNYSLGRKRQYGRSSASVWHTGRHGRQQPVWQQEQIAYVGRYTRRREEKVQTQNRNKQIE